MTIIKTNRSTSLFALLIACATLPGCVGLFTPDTVEPMPQIRYQQAQPAAKQAATELVFLPGIGDRAEDFANEDFVFITQQQLSQAGITAADAHVGYYKAKNMDIRLQADVIEPMLNQPTASGQKPEIWLIGISLGGLGSAIYASQHAEQLHAIVLIAPYLGEEELLEEIRSAGGPNAWYDAGKVSAGHDNREQAEEHKATQLINVWRWLIQNQRAGNEALPVFLLSGEQDKFIDAHKMLASILPRQQVMLLNGSHSWVAWRGLWSRFVLQQNLLTRAAR